MALSSSQQLVMAFAAVMFAFVVFPRMFGGGAVSKETRGFDPRFNRKGPGSKGHQFNTNTVGSKPQTLENMQQMKKMMEQELKSDKYNKGNSKGYVFTLMPLYAIGVGVFAAYKFLKIKSKEEEKAAQDRTAKGAKRSEETENQLNELEQRLAQTEKMLNSILAQLDPLTNCVKSVAFEQKNEIMSQLQCIRHLMQKRGMDWPPINLEEPSCERNLEDLIESLTAEECRSDVSPTYEQGSPGEEEVLQHMEDKAESDREEEEEEEEDDEEEEDSDSDLHMPPLEDSSDSNTEDVGSVPVKHQGTGLRRRHKPQ
ncbi:hypothetical protein MATL_G00262400 [Megalops atlanticus]|uniref:Resistance to inhibitors of cholinesterase protein 3 N-terminal domain-containing protein n=1 Tax=Megalops atlanticus TaxID=7932 RepID=A0A9D3STL0_MEGAT|nr:hypothetical protein MATL_G00262400 [Megalops atlanticus]